MERRAEMNGLQLPCILQAGCSTVKATMRRSAAVSLRSALERSHSVHEGTR